MKLSKNDKEILESYKSSIEGLAKYLGHSYEIVLHSLEDLDNSVIAICNGEHTGRKIGAPITDLALKMLDQIETTNENSIVYFSQNRKGEPLKSTTIAIVGENNKTIGLLCINMYLNTSFKEVLESFTPNKTVRENYNQNVEDLIMNAYEIEKNSVLSDNSILPSNKNKVIIERLYDKGIFQMKDAVLEIEKLTGLSKNTVYLHIRNHKKNLKDAK